MASHLETHWMKYSMLLAAILTVLSALACQTQGAPEVYEDVIAPVYPTADMMPTPVAEPLPPIRVWLSPEVDHPDEVRAGVEAWAYVFQGVREFVFVEATPDEVADTDVADVAIYQIGPYGGTCNPDPEHSDETRALGCVHEIGGLWEPHTGTHPIFLVDPNYTRAPMQCVIHEMGHLLGLVHADGGIMWGPAPEVVLDSAWECPDLVSVNTLADKLGLDRSSLHSCALPPAVAQLDADIISGKAL